MTETMLVVITWFAVIGVALLQQSNMRKPLKKTTPWMKIRRCVECKTHVSRRTMMESSGVCPHCGNSNPTLVVDVEETSVRYTIYRVPWLWFFTKHYTTVTEYKDPS